ncbi:MAG: NBR1-Ig-like domain-containing protein [Hydrogenophaga sp.]|nr:NBR1-Ig-like domain-containing protein [Hydrogenophaga sp.]
MHKKTSKGGRYQALGPSGLGNFVRCRSQQLGTSLSDIAERAGITRAYLHRLLLGNTPNPGVLTIQRLATALNLPAITLFRLYAEDACPSRSTAKRHEGLNDPDDGLVFVADVTVPDHALMAPGEQFTKTWAIQNVGSRPWLHRRLIRVDSELVIARRTPQGSLSPLLETHLSSLGNLIDVPPTQPGQIVELSVDMRAPEGSCTVTSLWQMVDADGQPCFSYQCYLYTVITVVGR